MNNLPKSVEVNGHRYHLAKLNPLTQFHVTRRLAPALATLGLGLARIKALAQAADQQDFMELLGPLSGVVAAMSDEDSSYVIRTCLEVVTREDSGQRAPIMVDARLMYEDIDMVTMLRLVFEMLRYNLAGFTQGPSGLTSSPGPSDTTAS
jgi:hypothetical protein